MRDLLHDFRFALRVWRHHPGFTAVALLSLALGIGANTSIFSVMDALLLRKLPVHKPEQLVMLGSAKMSGILNNFPDESPDLYSQPFLQRLREKNQVFSGVTAVESMRRNLHASFSGEGGEPEALKIRLVSGNYFALLGVGPAAGRVLSAEDDQKPNANPVAVMSYALWQCRFARATNAIGKTLMFNNTAFTIVGVATRDFKGTVLDESPDLWIPLSMQAKVQPWIEDPRGNLSQSLWLMGRLKPEVSLAAANANVNVIYQQWLHEIAGPAPSAERLQDMRKIRIELANASYGVSDLRRRFDDPLRILMVLVGLVLLIACVNIANLLLAQSTGRQREIAVRVALGAERRRLIRQLFSESILLSLAGGAIGVLIAWWGAQLLLTLVQNDPERIPIEVGPNGHVLLFSLGISLLTGIFFGMVPALRMTNVDVAPALKEGKGTARSQGHTRFGRVLVAVQVALALFLMIGAGLFVRTLEKLERTDTGFDRSQAILAQLDSDDANIKSQDWTSVRRRIEDRIRTLPGVEAASFAMLTFNEGRWMTPLWPSGAARTEHTAFTLDGNRVGPQYFKALGAPVVKGRGFGKQDTPQSPRVMMINEAAARKLYAGRSPIGQHLVSGLEKPVDYEIVGVVKDAKYVSLRESPRAMFFLDIEQEKKPDNYDDLVVGVRGNAHTIIPQIRAAIRSENPNLALWDVMTLDDVVQWSLGREKLLAKLAAFFGALALLLASIGLYGVMAYSVSRRTNEIGIRMALGAQPGSVLTLVLRESVLMVAAGFVVGIPAALACGRYVSSQLFGVQPNDVPTIVIASGTLLAIALLASFLPARRAAHLDPLTALREE